MMNRELLELYSDYLSSAFGNTIATGLSKLTNGVVSHDKDEHTRECLAIEVERSITAGTEGTPRARSARAPTRTLSPQPKVCFTRFREAQSVSGLRATLARRTTKTPRYREHGTVLVSNDTLLARAVVPLGGAESARSSDRG